MLNHFHSILQQTVEVQIFILHYLANTVYPHRRWHGFRRASATHCSLIDWNSCGQLKSAQKLNSVPWMPVVWCAVNLQVVFIVLHISIISCCHFDPLCFWKERKINLFNLRAVAERWDTCLPPVHTVPQTWENSYYYYCIKLRWKITWGHKNSIKNIFLSSFSIFSPPSLRKNF